MSLLQDYYNILGVSRQASIADIKQAYKQLAKQHHPDKNIGNAQAEELFKQLTHAYKVLTNPEKREQYDSTFFAKEKPVAGFESFQDTQQFFDQVFSRKQTQSRRAPGAGDYEAKVTISLLDAYQGSEKVITLQKKHRIRIRLKPGTKHGQVLKIKGLGAPARPGLCAGDLFLKIVIEKHTHFQLEHNDLYTSIDISVYRAILGGEISFKHIDGHVVKLTIERGIQPGTVLKIRGKGMPIQNSNTAGDLFVKLNIKIPTNLSEKEQQLMMELEKIGAAKTQYP